MNIRNLLVELKFLPLSISLSPIKIKIFQSLDAQDLIFDSLEYTEYTELKFFLDF